MQFVRRKKKKRIIFFFFFLLARFPFPSNIVFQSFSHCVLGLTLHALLIVDIVWERKYLYLLNSTDS